MSTNVQDPTLPPAAAPQSPPSEPEDQAYRRTVARVVFPEDRDLDTLPLYVDFAPYLGVDQSTRIDPGAPKKAKTDSMSIPVTISPAHAEYVRSRRSFSLPPGERVSFGTYFNAFPAAYWRRWTDIPNVRLTVRAAGAPTVIVYRSNSHGATERMTATTLTDGQWSIDLSLAPFGDGGWYWFDLAAGTEPAVLEEADWSVELKNGDEGTATLAITTFNRPDYCAGQLETLSRAPDTLALLDEVVIVDQGTQKVVDQPNFEELVAKLDGRVRVIHQPNLGGSGGFARGMTETVRAGRSRYVLLLDDDVVLEPEGIARAIAFGDLCRTPTIVGGHMFNMYERSILHSWAEAVNEWLFFWGPVTGTEQAHNFATSNLRRTAWLHKRFDVAYNGWWMCLIPTEIVRKIGVSLPLFIKWDDAEFGLRAGQAGYPTVTFPGAAVWHVPWIEKDDTVDWQAYYHQRNRWVVALLHSPYPRGGNMISWSLRGDLKQLLALQYSAVELRLQALEDLLNGPEHLHADLPTSLAKVRATRAEFSDAITKAQVDAFPPPRRVRPPKRGKAPSAPQNMLQIALVAATGALKQFRDVRESSQNQPEASLAAMDSKWWMLSRYDSALVTTADGTAQSWYKRDPERFRSMLARSIALHQRAWREWPELAERYQEALPELTSPQTWDNTFEAE